MTKPKSVQAEQLDRAGQFVARVLKKTAVGRADRVEHLPLLDIARENAEAWVSLYPPRAELGETGGSSTPLETQRESKERTEVYTLAKHATTRLRDIPKEIEALAAEMYSLVARVGEKIDHTKLPTKAVPGCRSHARTLGTHGRQIGGHFEPVYEKSQKSGLCRWCYDFVHANGGALPPIEACDVYSREGGRAAGTWLARNEKTWRNEHTGKGPARCTSRHLDTATELEYACALEADHDGQHQAVLVTGTRLTWHDEPEPLAAAG